MIGRKGIDVLLAACERLPKAGWTLTLAGDGPLRTKLEQAFRHRWGPDQVSFLGEIPYAERATIFEGHHVFVFPSRWDGWGMAPVEAMAAGLPVISTDQVMSMREFMREGENGYLVASEDPIALADRMCRFLVHPRADSRHGSGCPCCTGRLSAERWRESPDRLSGGIRSGCASRFGERRSGSPGRFCRGTDLAGPHRTRTNQPALPSTWPGIGQTGGDRCRARSAMAAQCAAWPSNPGLSLGLAGGPETVRRTSCLSARSLPVGHSA